MKLSRILSYLLAFFTGYEVRKLRSKLGDKPIAHVPVKPEKPRETDSPTSPPMDLMLAPVQVVAERSHVSVPATNENPRPLRGREKFREQLHLAHCTSARCSRGEDASCPVTTGLSSGYSF